MTKVAVLADGRELQFPDDLPDEEMHARVRETIRGEQTHAESTALDGQRNKLLMGLMQSIGQTNTLLAKLCKDQYATQQLLSGLVQRIGSLEQTIGQAAQRVEAAVTATAVQTVERGDDGKITKTTITKGVG